MTVRSTSEGILSDERAERAKSSSRCSRRPTAWRSRR